ncbi:MAG: hypothetical protein RJA21_1315 [Gemmatimonadota bacterium]
MPAIDEYLAENNRVYDQPTLPLLSASRDELVARVRWVEAALAELTAQAGEGAAAEFGERIGALTVGLAGELRASSSLRGERVIVRRRLGTLPLVDSLLPMGFRHWEFGPEAPPRDGTDEQGARFHAVNSLQEVQAADSCASMLFEAPDMPRDFYFDLGRHMWDEARYAVFGETKLAEFSLTETEVGLSSKA